ncbi:MAG: putative DNA binding domain-containing protein [Methanoregula sp.]|nr:putative DNA binding domain-containing protein [Methanoregula sp.]
MARIYIPTSPVLILTVDTNHKTKEKESNEYNPDDSFRFSGISENTGQNLSKTRAEIFHLLKENKIRWPDDKDELFINQSLLNGKDFFGNDDNARYLPAVSRLSGGVYGSMGERGKDFLLHSPHHFLIVSAAYGLLMPFESIQFYSCQFGDNNLTYEKWTQKNLISELLIDYINKYKIKRIFDFTYCSTLAYHECLNWPLINQKTGSEIFHGYHKWGKGDAALDYFGVYILDHMLLSPTQNLMELESNAWHHDHIFTIERKLFETKKPVNDNEFIRILADGENESVEFKARALWSLDPQKPVREKPPSNDEMKYGAKASKIIIAKTIAAFLNTDGGNLIVGIFENKNDDHDDHIVGIERDYAYLEDRCIDGYQRMVIDTILKPFFENDFFPHFSKFISIDFKKVQGKTVCWIKVKKSHHPVFVIFGKDEMFFVRTGPETRELRGKREVLNFISNHFK